MKTPEFRECFFCSTGPRKKIVKDFKYLQIAENSFPYDRIAETHHLLFVKRHIAEDILLLPEEHQELYEIKQKYIKEDYDAIIENFPRDQSIPDHFHLHLIKYKDF